MAIIEPSHIGHTPFQQLLGHHEDIMKTWSALNDTLENTSALNAELKEEIRRMLAQKNGCQY
ncbi:carboxymuconolactone decarboxylase family protein, partial [Staphylococcus epidermidis]